MIKKHLLIEYFLLNMECYGSQLNDKGFIHNMTGKEKMIFLLKIKKF